MDEKFNHGLPINSYNKHAWILGNPEIEERVWIGAFTLIDALHAPIKIGRGTDVSSGAQIITHSTVRRCISEKRHFEVDSSPTEIGEFCFIGTNAVILKGCKIGHHSVIGAGAVIPENTKIAPYSLVVGVPAKRVGSSKKFLKGVERDSLSVVIPAYNEEDTIERVANDALAVLKKLTIDFEIVFVDDGSTDNTAKIIDHLARKNKKIRAIHHKKNRGFTGAMKTALYSAKKPLVFLAPADGQFAFKELPKFVEAIRGYDGAIGYREIRDEGLARDFNSWGFHFLARNLLRIPFRQISSVFLWRRRVLAAIEIESENKSAMFLPEFFLKAVRLKYKFTEVPIYWHKRVGGKSKGADPVVIAKTILGMFRLWQKELSS